MSDALDNDRQFPDLPKCRGIHTDECRAVRSKAIRLALAMWGFDALSADFWQNPERFGDEAALRAAESVLNSSDDPVARSVTLILLDLAGTHAGRPSQWHIGAQVFQKLGGMLEVEQMLLLREFSESPVADLSAVDAILGLANRSSSSQEVRARALRALAGVGAFDSVNEVLLHAESPALGDDTVRALARCGLRCSASMQGMVSRNPESRLVLLRAIAGMAASDQRKALEAALRSLRSPAVLTFAELDQARFLMKKNDIAPSTEWEEFYQ